MKVFLSYFSYLLIVIVIPELWRTNLYSMENEQTITKRTQKEKSYIYLDMGIEEKLNQCFHFDIAISL